MTRAKLASKTFRVSAGHLVRTVKLKDGRSYTQEVTWCLEEHADHGATTGTLWEALPDVPCTQISVALDFLKERGCVRTEFRRCFPASGFLFEDAMVEYHALGVE
jgi:hypothetical protein